MTPEAERSRAKVSGTMIVESGTISCTRISAHCDERDDEEAHGAAEVEAGRRPCGRRWWRARPTALRSRRPAVRVTTSGRASTAVGGGVMASPRPPLARLLGGGSSAAAACATVSWASVEVVGEVLDVGLVLGRLDDASPWRSATGRRCRRRPCRGRRRCPTSSALNQVLRDVARDAWTWPVSAGTHQEWITSVESIVEHDGGVDGDDQLAVGEGALAGGAARVLEPPQPLLGDRVDHQRVALGRLEHGPPSGSSLSAAVSAASSAAVEHAADRHLRGPRGGGA